MKVLDDKVGDNHSEFVLKKTRWKSQAQKSTEISQVVLFS